MSDMAQTAMATPVVVWHLLISLVRKVGMMASMMARDVDSRRLIGPGAGDDGRVVDGRVADGRVVDGR